MKEKLIRYKKPVLLILIIIIIFCVSMYIDNDNKIETKSKENLKSATIVEKNTTTLRNKIYVDIKGAVKKPGVYEIESNYRVIDVVNVAGGFTKYADTSVINLGKKIKDQMVIIIYTKSEIASFKKKNQIILVNSDCPTTECICPDITNDACITTSTTTTNTTQTTTTKSSKVSINTGTIDELQTLTGIGLTKAQAIIDYRTNNGNFTKLEDLLNVSGIGTSTYDKIKDYITL